MEMLKYQKNKTRLSIRCNLQYGVQLANVNKKGSTKDVNGGLKVVFLRWDEK